MFCLRRAAFRALSASYTSIPKARPITTLTTSPFQRNTSRYVFLAQRRFASEEATEAETPVESEIEHTSEAQPEATKQASTPEEHQAASSEQNTVTSAVSSASESLVGNASGAADTVADVAQAAREYAANAAAAVGASAGVTSAIAGSDGSDSAQRSKRTPQSSTTLYVGNLFFDVNEEALKREMERFGAVKSVRIIHDARGLSKGFGYVEYEDPKNADKAIENLNQQVFEGRRMTVQYTLKQDKPPSSFGTVNPPSKTLFIGNMSFEMTDKDLNDLFRDIKNVIDVRVAIDRRTGQPRGFAHADFVDVASAEKGFQLLKDKEIYGRRLRIDYSTASSTSTPRSENRARR